MPSNLKRLTLESVGALAGGEAMEMFQKLVRRAVLDCMDRPGDKRVRKITLQLDLVPVPVITGNTIDCDSCNGTFQARCKIPDHATRQVNFGVQNSGDLIFNPDCPENHRQATMLEDE